MGKIIGAILLTIAIIALIGLAIGHYYISYQYEKVIGGYMDNAYDMNTPDKMLEQLQLAKQGMIDEGLTEDMYGAWIFKKPSNRMDMQYKHLDSIIERVKAVDTWYNETYKEGSTNTETLGDVYEQKMDNLREFIMEDVRSDWIAKDTWYINNHFFWYLPILFVYSFLIILGAICIILIYEDNNREKLKELE